MAGLISKENHMRPALGSSKATEFMHSSAKSPKFTGALTSFSHMYCPDSLNTTSLSQGYVLEAASWNGEGKWNPHSQDRRGGEESPLAGIQVTGELEVPFLDDLPQ